MNEVFINDFQRGALELVDTMIGCACDLNQHNYETLIKTREHFVDYINTELTKNLTRNFRGL